MVVGAIIHQGLKVPGNHRAPSGRGIEGRQMAGMRTPFRSLARPPDFGRLGGLRSILGRCFGPAPDFIEVDQATQGAERAIVQAT